ncbi:putative pentatricopeptide repeat-containing protein At1g10330 [Ricinus communis]|nr:putative pentatricopeptide repeat-containing protein At1g10330 [Ricinus communis]|eukprot:XP_015578246.1 putative pentatricopeptide repeat-containing protein At1g10330 [Ricinus communis]
MRVDSGECLLQLLQRFIKCQNQVEQIHSLLLTKAHLLFNPTISSHSKWKSTLFYNTLTRAYLNFGQTYNTVYLFTLMLAHQTPPNSHTFPSLIKAATLSFPSIGTSLHTQVIKRGVLCDPFVQTSLLAFYSQIGCLYNAHKVFDGILHPWIVEYNAMLDAYAKNNDMGSAILLFKRMLKRDVVSWTTVISGFSRSGLFREAINFFRVMIAHEDVSLGLVKPNEATYVSVLSSCASLDEGGSLFLGKQMHGSIIRNEVVLTVFIGTALIDFYGKVGCLNSAIRVFNSMTIKQICSWNAMISCLANNGREKQALDMFEMMEEKGPSPNEVTFVVVLTACTRAKLVQFGMRLFQSMWSDYSVKPIMEHYGCVVDLLGRAGLLREASEIIRSMPFEPDASVLGALLGACKIHGANKLANEVGGRLLRLQPLHCGQFVLLSNINAGLEKWSVAADVRKAMVEAGISKVPAYSLINYMGKT